MDGLYLVGVFNEFGNVGLRLIGFADGQELGEGNGRKKLKFYFGELFGNCAHRTESAMESANVKSLTYE